MDFERVKDVLLQVELEHRLLVALVSPAWVAQSSRIVRLMVELKGALLAWREKVAARDAGELSQPLWVAAKSLLKR